MLYLFLVCSLFCCLHWSTAEDLSVSHLVLGQGYPFEEHEVVTEDGYILAVHRIPYGKNSPGKIGRPVIVQHGVMASSACWVLARPDNSLGFIMADQGYDVWMPNNRGNTYSMKHKTLDPNKRSDVEKFWDFSFHEMGYYDLPAIIDYVLNKTGHEKLYHIGHSQGTTQLFVMMSMRPEYNKKVVHASALAPIAFLDHTRGTLKGMAFFGSWFAYMARFLNIHSILTSTPLIHGIEKMLCRTITMTGPLCENILFLITGFDPEQIESKMIPIITTYTPAGSSAKQLIHFGQLTNNGKRFSYFDYGSEENLRRYNQTTPPDYDLSKVTVPVMLHYSENDWISGIPDVMKLKSHLPNAKERLVPFKNFNHLGFMWAKDVWHLLYKPMLETMKQY